MKKRSLVSAVAMLIVSAIVLTSATYAWFASTAADISVDEISASVSNSDGSVLLKAVDNAAEGAIYKPTLTSADFDGIVDILKPVSLALNAEGTAVDTIKKVSYDGATFTNLVNADLDADLAHYSFDVQLKTSSATASKTVKMTPSFTRSANFAYAIVKVGDQIQVLSGTDDSYFPLTSLTGVVTDDVTNGEGRAIVDAADAGTFSLGSKVNGGGASQMTIFNAKVAAEDGVESTFNQLVEVYIWAEGNDLNCSGTIADAANTMSFTFDVA